jgi:arylsulfatase A-like enzyme
MTHLHSRRSFLRLTAAGAGYALLGGPRADAAQERRTNVVMMVGDDMGWSDFGFTGNKEIRTPRLDRLAGESAVFPRGYTPCSLCRASLATLLTGLYPHQHRICCNDPPQGVERDAMHPFIKTAPALPRLLGQAKYRSLQTGKFWEGHYSNAGFTDGETTNADRHIAKKAPQIGRDTMRPIYDFIDKHRGDPFFVWYAPMMPHYPHNPPERLLKQYAVKGRNARLAAYFAMCEWFDETCGQLLDHLDKRGLARDTLVVFCIDNGWVQPTEEEKKRSPFGGPRGKRSPYEMGIRTPVILRLPGRTRAGRYDDLVSTVDLAPTILRACGQKPPAEMQGLDLMPRASGGAALKRDAVFGDIYVHSATNLKMPRLDMTHRWARVGDWKLILPADNKDIELFDLARDPHEKNNLAKQHPERVRELTKRIEAWWAER